MFAPTVTLILGIATGLWTLNTYRRTDFDRAHRLHTELTTGPVAEARHIVGSAFEDPTRGHHPKLTSKEIKALFAVLWCFERIDAQRETLLGRWTWLPAWINPRAALDASIRFHVRIYVDYLRRATAGENGLSITIRPGEASLMRLAARIGEDSDHEVTRGWPVSTVDLRRP